MATTGTHKLALDTFLESGAAPLPTASWAPCWCSQRRGNRVVGALFLSRHCRGRHVGVGLPPVTVSWAPTNCSGRTAADLRRQGCQVGNARVTLLLRVLRDQVRDTSYRLADDNVTGPLVQGAAP